MKKLKKLASVLLTLAMVFGLCAGFSTTASAAEGDPGTVTITGVEADDQTFEAFQIFAGTLSQDGLTLSNITWGESVDQAKLGDMLTAIQGIEVNGTYPFAGLSDAAEIAAKLAEYSDYDNEVARLFAAAVRPYLGNPVGTSGKAADAGDDTFTYTISDLPYGYYLIDNQGSVTSDEAATRYLLTVVNDNATIVVKEEVPSMDKTITSVEREEGQSAGSVADNNKSANASIGDVIGYELVVSVPDVSDYNYYYFIATDKLSDGLTFNEGSVKVTVTLEDGTVKELTYASDSNGTGATGDEWFYVEYDEITNSFKVVLHDYLQYGATGATTVKITYTATLNDNAVIGTAGNENDADLTYSNDPNYDYSGSKEPGEPGDEPGDDVPTGQTPESKTYTYVTGIQLTKVDASTSQALAGAEFTLTGQGVNYVVTQGQVYTEDATNGSYYKLKDGTYTNQAPTEETMDQYDNPDVKYKLETTVTVQSENGETVGVTAFVDPVSGVVTFEGLSEGTYTVSETVVPDGYNKIEDFTIEISWEAPTDTEKGCTWTATSGDENVTFNEQTGVFEITVKNSKGSSLPSTGGMGTTIFYVIGAILVFGAAVLLITRRRMNRA